MSLTWDDVRADFGHDDGSFCDLLVRGPDAKMRDLLDVIRQRCWACKYTEDGIDRRLPTYDEIKQAQQERAPLLTFWPGGTLPLNVHFFNDEVEATFDPRSLQGQEDLDVLLTCMRVLGRHFSSPVTVTVESSPEAELLRFKPESDGVVHVRPS